MADLKDFKREINQELNANATEVKAQGNRIGEMEARFGETDTWNMAVKEALLTSLEQQRIIQEALTDLEGRSRRTNMRIYNVPEDAEKGSSVREFIETLLKGELSLPADTDLQIQRAHRALAQKPGPNSPPRSIVINFLQFGTKEMVLKKAWQRKIEVGGRHLSFDHGYATAVV